MLTPKKGQKRLSQLRLRLEQHQNELSLLVFVWLFRSRWLLALPSHLLLCGGGFGGILQWNVLAHFIAPECRSRWCENECERVNETERASSVVARSLVAPLRPRSRAAFTGCSQVTLDTLTRLLTPLRMPEQSVDAFK